MPFVDDALNPAAALLHRCTEFRVDRNFHGLFFCAELRLARRNERGFYAYHGISEGMVRIDTIRFFSMKELNLVDPKLNHFCFILQSSVWGLPILKQLAPYQWSKRLTIVPRFDLRPWPVPSDRLYGITEEHLQQRKRVVRNWPDVSFLNKPTAERMARIGILPRLVA